MNTKHTTSTVLSAAAVLAALAVGIGGISSTASAERRDLRSGTPTYTVLDHPAKACHLSVQAVANWGETSAHLPQACRYGR